MSPRDVAAILFGGMLLYVTVRVFQSPLRWALRAAINGLFGLGALWVWDQLFKSHGWAVGLNPVTGATIGVLGPPGFVLVVLVRLWRL
ncbi:MAG: pro-sigmaK processing inhibitor BofA family protein [Firmicutes bacterium]|nr:pro-sigmaK processing inhibitor BofA family protein [Bacillota bacterium]